MSNSSEADSMVDKKSSVLVAPKERFPEKIINSAAKAAGGIADIFMPGTSGVAGFFLSFHKTSYQKRCEKFEEDIIEALQRKGVAIEELKNSEEFNDIALQAMLIIMKHHQEEKKQALKNAIIHVATNNAPDFSVQQIFLTCIDNFTIWHINILILFSDPDKWFDKLGKYPGSNPRYKNFGAASAREILLLAFPNLPGDEFSKLDFIKYIWIDLYGKGFLLEAYSDEMLNRKRNLHKGIEKRTTTLGNDFLKFISD